MISSLHRPNLRTKPGTKFFCKHPTNTKVTLSIRDAYLTCKDCKINPHVIPLPTEIKEPVIQLPQPCKVEKPRAKLETNEEFCRKLTFLIGLLKKFVLVLEKLKKIQKEVIINCVDRDNNIIWKEKVFEEKRLLKNAHHSLNYLFTHVQQERKKTYNQTAALYKVENTYYTQICILNSYLLLQIRRFSYILSMRKSNLFFEKVQDAFQGLLDFDDIISKFVQQYSHNNFTEKKEAETRSTSTSSQKESVQLHSSSDSENTVKQRYDEVIQDLKKSQIDERKQKLHKTTKLQQNPQKTKHSKTPIKIKNLATDIQEELKLSKFSMRLLDIKTRLLCYAESTKEPQHFMLPANLSKVKASQLLAAIRRSQYNIADIHYPKTSQVYNINALIQKFSKPPSISTSKKFEDDFNSSDGKLSQTSFTKETKELVKLPGENDSQDSHSFCLSEDAAAKVKEILKEKQSYKTPSYFKQHPPKYEHELDFQPYVKFEYSDYEPPNLEKLNNYETQIYSINPNEGWSCLYESKDVSIKSKILQDPLRLQISNRKDPVSLIHICNIFQNKITGGIDITIPYEKKPFTLKNIEENQESLLKILNFRQKCFQLCKGDFKNLQIIDKNTSYRIYDTVSSNYFIINKTKEDTINYISEVNEMQSHDYKLLTSKYTLKTDLSFIKLQQWLQEVASDTLSILHGAKLNVRDEENSIPEASVLYINQNFIIKNFESKEHYELTSAESFRIFHEKEEVHIYFRLKEFCIISGFSSNLHLRAFGDLLDRIILFNKMNLFEASYKYTIFKLTKNLFDKKTGMSKLLIKYANIENEWSILDFKLFEAELNPTVIAFFPEKTPDGVFNHIIKNIVDIEEISMLQSVATISFATKFLLEFESPLHQLNTHLLAQANLQQKTLLEAPIQYLKTDPDFEKIKKLLLKINKASSVLNKLQRLNVEVRRKEEHYYEAGHINYTLSYILLHDISIKLPEGICLLNLASVKKLESTLSLIALKSKKNYYVKFSTSDENNAFLKLCSIILDKNISTF